MAEPGAPEIAATAPERLLVVPAILDGGAARFVLVRWLDWPQPALLSMAPPAANDTLEDAATDLVMARLHLEATSAPRISSTCIPVRMGAPRLGLTATGWLRAVLVPVRGEPQPDALIEGAEVLLLDEALDALSTEVERLVLREAAALAQ